MNKTRVLAAAIVGLLTVMANKPLRAQLAPAGDAGVVMGQLHLTVKNLDAQRAFWSALGGPSVQNRPLALIQFPGTFVMLRQAEPAGGTVGSTINHVGFLVKDIQSWIAKWQGGGAAIAQP